MSLPPLPHAHIRQLHVHLLLEVACLEKFIYFPKGSAHTFENGYTLILKLLIM